VFGTSPQFPSGNFFTCIAAAFHFPYGLYGLGICVGALAVLIVMVMRMGYSETGEYDRDRNLIYSNKGTYGTAGFMTKKELKGVLDLVPNIRKHPGIILGELDGQVVCVPEKTRFNGNLAVYGASGSKKTRAFCMNMILQTVARRHSLVICDPKSELYEKSSQYLRDKGYTVKVFNLVTPSCSDSWNCLAEINGQELMAQLFCDVIIKNTGGGKADHFWDNAEMNLLKALVLYVERGYPDEKKNIGEVYKLLTMSSEQELNALFDNVPISHPAKAPYSIFKQSGESVRGGVIIGLGSRLQVFQNSDIREITGHTEIDLELPGKQPCAYFCITSDQDSTFDFLSSLFLSFVFIRLVRYADQECPGGALPVPVHVLGEELCACGVIPDLSRKISVIRSRNISMSCVFQNLAGLQNRYPLNQWQEILGNCDVTLFLGCTDALTADFISQRTGEASISVTSKAKQLGSWRISNYTPEYRETNLGVSITKRGNAEALSGSSMRYDFTVANTSNVPLSNFYWHDRIPTDAARATVLTTGTYSARLNYRILYKTNYTANYQVLASNLLTNSSYSFSLNAIPTQAGEYVTDVYFDFGKVPVGFQSVANPTLTVVVSGTAANGYQLVNRADVGGKYQGTWQTAQATWVTIIRKLTPTVPLPKTGY